MHISAPQEVQSSFWIWFNFFLQYFSPSGCCFRQVQAQGNIMPHCWVLLSASNYYWMYLVSLCIHNASFLIWLLLAGAYTLCFFEIRGRTVQPSRVALDSPTTTFKGCILLPGVFCYISPEHSDQKFESSVQLAGFVFGSLHHRGKLYQGESSTVSTLINLHLLQGRRPIMRMMVPPSFRLSTNLRSNWGCTTIYKTIDDQRSVSQRLRGTATKRPPSHTNHWQLF